MLDNGNWLFTRKGSIFVNKVVREYALEKGDKILVEDGHRILKGEALYSHGGKEVTASDIAYVSIRGDKIYLVSQDQKLEIRNGSEVVIKTGDYVAAQQTIATFDPFSEPIISEIQRLRAFRGYHPRFDPQRGTRRGNRQDREAHQRVPARHEAAAHPDYR